MSVRKNLYDVYGLQRPAIEAFYAGFYRGQRDALLTLARVERKHPIGVAVRTYVDLARSAHWAYLKEIRRAQAAERAAAEQQDIRLMRLLRTRRVVRELQA
jgi:hypothetical protein